MPDACPGVTTGAGGVSVGRRCAPEWPIVDGVLEPVAFELSRRSSALDAVHWRLQALDVPEGVSVYLRGGMLEQMEPHPGADIDVIVLGPAERAKAVAGQVNGSLSALGRPIEAVPCAPEVLQAHVPLRMLVQCRALLVGGHGVTLPPLRADEPLRRSLWNFYAPFLLRHSLQGPLSARLVTVKYALRAVGVLGLFEGRYSRDLPTCLGWCERYAPEARAILERALLGLEEPEPAPLDLRPALVALEQAYVHLSNIRGRV